MQCPKCKSSNPPGSLYCVGCGLSQAQQRKLLENSNTDDQPNNLAKIKLKKVAVPKKVPQKVISKPQVKASSNPLHRFLQSGELLEGKFKLNKEIGRGGMGHVYASQDKSLGRDVAVKVLPPHYNDDESVVARFQREARAMASLDHPNIVTVYSIGHDAELHYFVMKLLDGETLAHKLKRQEIGQIKPYSIKTIIELLIQACNGLEHAHNKGLLHRDIKPGNLMLNQEYKLTIMDFGIVKRLDNSSVETVGLQTAHGKIFGTPEYMPPEQAMGKGEYAAGSDVYALAVVAYELLCGELPFEGDTPLEIILQHIRAAAPSFKGRAQGKFPTFERVIQKAMAKTLDDRYANASEFRAALQGALMNEHSVQVSDLSTNPRQEDNVAHISSQVSSDQSSSSHMMAPAALQTPVTAPFEADGHVFIQKNPPPSPPTIAAKAPSESHYTASVVPQTPPQAPPPLPPQAHVQSQPKPYPPTKVESKNKSIFKLNLSSTDQTTTHQNTHTPPEKREVTPASKRPGHYKGLPIKRKK